MPNKQCIRCKKWKASKNILLKTQEWCYSLLESEGISLSNAERISLCNKCWFNLRNMKKETETQPESDTEDMDTSVHDDEDLFTVENILFAGSGHKKCVICKAEISADAIIMPKIARLDFLVLKRMYAPHGVRCCKQHLWNNRLLPNVEINMINRQTSMAKLESSALLKLFNDVLGLLQEATAAARLDFTDASLSDEDYLAWTGWNKLQFEHMVNLVQPHIRTSSNREARNAMAMFWIKLKTNLSFRQIGSLFNISGDGDNRRKLISRTFDSIRQILIEKLVPQYLGIGHLSRTEAINHNTSFSNQFFGKNVTIIWDGTYFYTGKSSSHEFQRSTYSGQKKRHLVKFMSLCLPDGYCLDTLGPFFGTQNDATITNHITKTRNTLAEWCEDGDNMVLDRGFRDIVKVFSDLGYEPKMPVYLPKGQKQHTTQEANDARLVTKVRWTVESYHARLKKWRFFSDKIENQMLPKLQDCVRMVSAALNCFRGSIIKDHNTVYMDKLAQLMMVHFKENNYLASLVEQGKLSAKQQWKKIDEINFDFLEMDLEDLRQLFFGTYQIKQSQTYAEEHLDINGDFAIQISKETAEIIRCAVQSRHTNSTRYYLWIQFSLTGNPIKSWYCQCKSGARTLGACAHVATIIWYLSYARHFDFQPSDGRRRIQQAIETIGSEDDDDNTDLQ